MGINWKNVKSFLYESKFIILLYVIGDWATTVYALPVGVEYNSIPSLILARTGIYGLLFVKLVFMVLLYWGYVHWVSNNTQVKNWKIVKHFIEIVGVFVVTNNLMVIMFGNSLVQMMGLV